MRCMRKLWLFSLEYANIEFYTPVNKKQAPSSTDGDIHALSSQSPAFLWKLSPWKQFVVLVSACISNDGTTGVDG